MEASHADFPGFYDGSSFYGQLFSIGYTWLVSEYESSRKRMEASSKLVVSGLSRFFLLVRVLYQGIRRSASTFELSLYDGDFLGWRDRVLALDVRKSQLARGKLEQHSDFFPGDSFLSGFCFSSEASMAKTAELDSMVLQMGLQVESGYIPGVMVL